LERCQHGRSKAKGSEMSKETVYFGKQGRVTGKRKAGDDDDAGIERNKPSNHVVIGKRKAGDDDDACIECNKPSHHSCRRCKKRVCSMCSCYEKRKLENTWWCDVCFKRQSKRSQGVIRNGDYSSSDEI
jgi:hypothetical protein